jgi:alpha-beta hydrolase superfamily lysophospholipase
MRTAVTTALALLAAALTLVAAGPGSSSPGSPVHACVGGDELRFRAPDGVRLVGHRFGGAKPKPRRTAVVLAHMSVGDLCQWAPFARRLARQGLFVFPFDLRGHGLSEGAVDHSQAATDLAGAVRTVRRLGARKVVVVGASLGGIAALVAAPRLGKSIAGVAAVSSPAAIAGELDAMPAVPQLTVPTLYVAASADQNPPYDFAADARALYEATGTAAKRLALVDGSLHGVFLVDGSTSVRNLLLAFIRNPARVVRA